MEAVIYTRVSLDRSAGRSVDDQERECRAECARKGWDVRAVYTDRGLSASRYGRHRPQWEKCKATLKADDVLVVWEASRAQRDLQEFVKLRDICAALGVLVSYSGRVLDLSKGDDRFTGGLDALLAERESEYLRERVQRGKRTGALQGRPAGRTPWGYVSVSPGIWAPHPTEAPKIQEAVGRILRGESHYAVWQWMLGEPGYHPPTLTVMSRSLRSPTLAGLRIHRGEVVGKGSWEPLITEADHRQLATRQQRLRAARRHVSTPGPEPKHLLSGIATCGRCGDPLAWRKNRHGTPIYVCKNGHVSRLAATVDEAVESRLFNRLSEIDPADYEADDSTVAEAWHKIDLLEEQRAEWQEMALAGSITPQSFATFESSIEKKIAALEADAAPRETATVDLQSISANWSHMPMRERRLIIRAFFRVTIVPSTRGGKAGAGGIDIVAL